MDKNLEKQINTYSFERLEQLHDFCECVSGLPKKNASAFEKIIEELNQEIVKLKSDLFIFSVQKSAHHMNALHNKRSRVQVLSTATESDEVLKELTRLIIKDKSLRFEIQQYIHAKLFETSNECEVLKSEKKLEDNPAPALSPKATTKTESFWHKLIKRFQFLSKKNNRS